MTEVVAYFDGECTGNEQPDPGLRRMRGAFVLGGVNHVEPVTDVNGGPASNNTAEYLGLQMLLDEIWGSSVKEFYDSGMLKWPVGTKFIICGDSKLVVEQMRSVWTVKKPHLQQLKRDAEATMGSMPYDFEFRWVPREKNLAGFLLD